MSEFDEALAEAVQDDVARGGLPGAADAIRRGRRRSLRARGGITMLGVAVVAGAIGGAGMLGGRADSAGAASGLGGHAGEGVLPAAQWPGYDLEHWTVSPNCGAADRSKCKPGDATDPNITDIKVTDWFGVCTPGQAYPVRRYVQFATQYDAVRKLDADEIVVTLPDENTAAAFMADIRAVAPGRDCVGSTGAEHSTLGVGTADGVSWRVGSGPGVGYPFYEGNYAVQAGNRVAYLRVNESDKDTVLKTIDDSAVLHDLAVALND